MSTKRFDKSTFLRIYSGSVTSVFPALTREYSLDTHFVEAKVFVTSGNGVFGAIVKVKFTL